MLLSNYFRAVRAYPLKLNLRCYFSQQSEKSNNSSSVTVDSSSQKSDLPTIKNPHTTLMEDNYESTTLPGLQNRNMANLTDLQRQIITNNKFDLMNAAIQPKPASLKTTLGIQVSQRDELAQISLGNVQIKNHNQIFLSQVDPYNIPEYYDIVFDKYKGLSLLGRKILKGTAPASSSQMKVASSSFQEKSNKQIQEEVIGITWGMIHSLRRWMQLNILFVFGAFILIFPILDVYKQLTECLQSIEEIEKESLDEYASLKRRLFVNALLNNPDFNTAERDTAKSLVLDSYV